jgi:type II secretion system protein D
MQKLSTSRKSEHQLMLLPRRLICFLLIACFLGMISEMAWAQQQRPLTGTRATGAYPGNTGVGSATFSNDPETRKLIVVTDAETASQIRQVIANLDRPVPQVLIKVVFLEVTYRKGLDFGIEGAHRRNIDNTTTGAINQVFGLASQGAFPTPPGAGIYQILGADFQATLRAIAEAGKTEVLSRPTVLARNNQQAIITVGQQIPLITNVRYDTFGNQINAVSYQDVGIILRVTPFITSDGMVEMIVFPEISNLSDRTVPISAGVNAPVINSRSADTVVVTPDGQTVVIGGLMENNKTQTDSKIPVLGDIPLLGNLFKRKVRSDAKTELLIFLTPHIVKRPSDLAAITDFEKSNTQIVPQSFSEQELDRFFDKLESQPAPEIRQRRR